MAPVTVPRDVFAAMVGMCFDQMPEHYAGGDGPSAVIEWRLKGPVQGTWQVRVADGRAAVERTTASPADVTFALDAVDFVALCLGQASGPRLWMEGRMRVEGSKLLAARVPRWFRPPARGR